MLIQMIVDLIDEIAPFENAEAYDNVGLLVGDLKTETTKVMVCLDCTLPVIEKAIAHGCNVIVSHHPLMMKGIKHLRHDEYEGRVLRSLVQNNMSLIAVHTNLDAAEGGVEDCLAEALGIIVDTEEHFMRAGTVRKQTVNTFALALEAKLKTKAMMYGDPNAIIKRVAVSCGGGGSHFREALAARCDLFVTGEMKHHERIEAQGFGLNVIIAGHEETERIALPRFAQMLRDELGIEVIEEEQNAVLRH